MWYLARSISILSPALLLVLMSSSLLSSYFFLMQSFQVIAIISSAGMVSAFLANEKKINVFNFFKTQKNIFIYYIFVCSILTTLYLTFLDQSWIYIFLISLGFSFRLFLQTILKKYYNETLIIFISEVVFGLSVISSMLFFQSADLAINISLIISFSLLLVFLFKIKETPFNNLTNVTLFNFIERTFTFSIQTALIPFIILVFMANIGNEKIITIKLAFILSSGLVWIQSSIKSQYLKDPNLLPTEILEMNRLKIILISIITISIIILAYIISEYQILNMNLKYKSSELFLFSSLVFLANLSILIAVIYLGYDQWKIYTGVYAKYLSIFNLILGAFVYFAISKYSSIFFAGFLFVLTQLMQAIILFTFKRVVAKDL